MNPNYPPKVRSMLERLALIKTDLSGVTMSVSLDRNFKDLPETNEILSSITSEDKNRLLMALEQAFANKDLTRVIALYSYIVLFQETDQTNIKQEVIRYFLLYIKEQKNDAELNAMFLHPGFPGLVSGLNDRELTDLQFNLFSRYLDNKTAIGTRIVGVQKNLPLREDQKKEVLNYLDEIKAEKEKVENKTNRNRSIIIIVLVVTLFIIRMVLRTRS